MGCQSGMAANSVSAADPDSPGIRRARASPGARVTGVFSLRNEMLLTILTNLLLLLILIIISKFVIIVNIINAIILTMFCPSLRDPGDFNRESGHILDQYVVPRGLKHNSESFSSKSRLWNLEYENPKYESGRIRELEYRTPRLHSAVNFWKVPEISGDVCRNNICFL